MQSPWRHWGDGKRQQYSGSYGVVGAPCTHTLYLCHTDDPGHEACHHWLQRWTDLYLGCWRQLAGQSLCAPHLFPPKEREREREREMKVTGLSEKRKMSALLFCCLLIVLINLTIMWLALLPMLKDCGSDHVLSLIHI